MIRSFRFLALAACAATLAAWSDVQARSTTPTPPDVGFFPAPTADNLRKHQNTVLVALVWWVGNKSGAW